MILSKAEIKKLIEQESMIIGYIDFNGQLQPNGFDLTLDKLYEIRGCGFIGRKEKYIPDGKEIELELLNDLYELSGINSYLFTVNETVKLPLDVCAITIQRSSIMRCGITTNIGFWDSGYNGKGFSMLNVMNKYGFTIQRDARIIQMVFMKNTDATEGYHGQYQFEGIKKPEIYHSKIGSILTEVVK